MLQFTGTQDYNKETETLETLLDWNVDGIIWHPHGPPNDYTNILAKIKQTNTHIVIIQQEIENAQCDAIITEYSNSQKLGIKHLIDQGYQCIFFLQTRTDFDYQQQRENEFIKGCKELGISCHPIKSSGPLTSIKNKLNKHIQQIKDTKLKAVVCSSDWQLPRIHEVLQEADLSIPADLGLVTIGDILLGGNYHISELFSPHLTSIQQEYGDQAKLAMKMLLERINTSKPYPPKVAEIPMQLNIQKSTLRIS